VVVVVVAIVVVVVVVVVTAAEAVTEMPLLFSRRAAADMKLKTQRAINVQKNLIRFYLTLCRVEAENWSHCH